MRRLLWTLVALLLSAVLLSYGAPPASAQDFAYTSTADFDAGTKSDPGDGNYGVETNTDNPGITTGQLELASLKGDSFTLADTDADTFKWDLSGSNNPTINQRAIADGVFRLNITQSAGVPTASIISSSTLSGGLDIRVQFDYVYTTATASPEAWLLLVNEQTTGGMCGVSGTATVDGLIYRYRQVAGPGFDAFTCTNNAGTQIGTRTTNAADPKWMRMTRVGTTVTWYFSTDGSVWTEDETTTFATTASLFVQIGIFLNGAVGNVIQFDYDDFHVASGTVDASGYRTSGDWISPTFNVPSGERVDTITLTHSGLSGTYYIDTVELRDSAGTVVGTWADDIASGTSTVLTATTQTNGDMSVRVYLAGDGAGTPVLEAVEIDLVVIEQPGGHTDPRYRAVIVSCTYGWPDNAVHCSAIERIDPRFVATRSWFVDGRAVDGANNASLDHDLGILPAVPFSRAVAVTYVVRTTGDADVSDSVTVRADSSWLIAVYGLGFIAVLGLVVVRHEERRPAGREEPMP